MSVKNPNKRKQKRFDDWNVIWMILRLISKTRLQVYTDAFLRCLAETLTPRGFGTLSPRRIGIQNTFVVSSHHQSLLRTHTHTHTQTHIAHETTYNNNTFSSRLCAYRICVKHHRGQSTAWPMIWMRVTIRWEPNSVHTVSIEVFSIFFFSLCVVYYVLYFYSFIYKSLLFFYILTAYKTYTVHLQI